MLLEITSDMPRIIEGFPVLKLSQIVHLTTFAIACNFYIWLKCIKKMEATMQRGSNIDIMAECNTDDAVMPLYYHALN